METLRMTSPDLTDGNIDKIAELFPNVITETLDEDGTPRRGVDFDMLRQELSGHVVEARQERYQLDWPGKRAAAFAANAPIAKTLRPDREESVDFDSTKNLFIEGDNLEALKLLQEPYLGKVKLIYIDPPYNTGNDFIYADDFAQTTDAFLELSGLVDDEGYRLVTNAESNGRFHSDWLSMIYPRLRLARNLMREDGVLFASIDDVEAPRLRMLCEEVFGSQNVLGTLIHQRAKGGGNAKHLVRGHDYILVVAKDISKVHALRRDKVVQGRTETIDGVEYLVDDDVLRKTFGRYEAGTERRCLYEEITKYKGEAKLAEVDAAILRGDLFLIPWTDDGKHAVAKRVPLDTATSKLYSVLKVLSELGTLDLANLEMEGVFDYPKPVELMRLLIRAATTSTEHEIVLDLFAGSGSLSQAVLELNSQDGGNRQFISIQFPEVLHDALSKAQGPARVTLERAISFLDAEGRPPTIAGITKERIRRAGTRTLDNSSSEAWNRDIGFRSLRVDTTSMADVLRAPDDTNQASIGGLEGNIKPGRTGEDLLFQVLLDWGLELTLPIAHEYIDGHDIHSVDGDSLIACFDEHVGPELVRTIAQRRPLRAVFRDSGFASDADRINAEQIFREISPGTDVKAI